MAEKNANSDVEGQRPQSISHFRTIIDQGVTTPEIENWQYDGSGTKEDPYVVVWIENDPRNPMDWKPWYRWMAVLTMAFSVLAVTFNSSAYSGGKLTQSLSVHNLS